MNFQKIELFLLIIVYVLRAKLLHAKSDLKLCIPTEKNIALDHECSEYKTIISKMLCVSTFNMFEEIRSESDQFHRVRLLKETIIVYSNDGRIFETKCENVENVEFPEFVENCTRDLPISFSKNGIKTSGFINKVGIIREKSILKGCDNEIQVFNLEQKRVASYQNMITVINEVSRENTDLRFSEENDQLDDNQFSFLFDFFIRSNSRIENYSLLFFFFVFFFIIRCCKSKKTQKPNKTTTAGQNIAETAKTLREFFTRQQSSSSIQSASSIPGIDALIAAASVLEANNFDTMCKFCNKIFKNKRGLAVHQKACEKSCGNKKKGCFFNIF